MIFYLQIIITYIKLKLKIHTSKQEVWRLDMFAYSLKYNFKILSEKKEGFIIEYKLNKIYNFKIRHFPSSDFSVFKSVIIEKQYNLNYFSKPNSNNQINIIDGGANVGYTTIYLKDRFPNSNIICIEPSLKNIQALKYNLELNNLKNIKVINSALWYEKTSLKINSEFRDRREHSFRTVKQKNTEGEMVESITIYDIIKDNNIKVLDILKLDIEGSENEIFTFDSKLTDCLIITQNVVIEIHDEFNCREKIESTIQKHFKKMTQIGELTFAYNCENDI